MLTLEWSRGRGVAPLLPEWLWKQRMQERYGDIILRTLTRCAVDTRVIVEVVKPSVDTATFSYYAGCEMMVSGEERNLVGFVLIFHERLLQDFSSKRLAAVVAHEVAHLWRWRHAGRPKKNNEGFLCEARADRYAGEIVGMKTMYKVRCLVRDQIRSYSDAKKSEESGHDNKKLAELLARRIARAQK